MPRLYRKELNFLEKWRFSPDRKPLVIRGARQVGKSTLIRLFAEQSSLPLAEVNLEQFSKLDPAFETLQPRHILNELEALPGMPSITTDSLLFLDEIQEAPAAIPALRYFHEQMHELPVVAAGSLLEFALADHDFSMPVGRIQYLHMGPMTFLEFLEALEEYKLKQEIEAFALGKSIGTTAHQRLLELLRSYYFVGGMPESVSAFARSRKYSDVSPIHNSIIETYREDFPKYAGSRNLARLLHVFHFAARNVGVKIKYSNISRDEQSGTLRKDIELLCMARVLSKVVHTHASGLPLQADLEPGTYKLLFLDIGLMNAIAGLSWNTFSRMDDVQLINEGANAEQFVGQHLQSLLADSPNRELTYWLREGKTANAEVDFTVAFDGRILPVEVKAGTRGSLRSLHQFAGEKSAELAIRFDSNPPSLQTIETRVKKVDRNIDVKYRLLSLPIYLVERLRELASEAADGNATDTSTT